MLVEYDKAEEILQEGDILLFRGKGLISFLIQRYTGGLHSHVALASKCNDVWMCVEFREFKGGRSVSLKNQVGKNPTNIDVFRPLSSVSFQKMNEDKTITTVNKTYTNEMAHSMTQDIISWTGQEYGWKNIFQMFSRFLPGIRLLRGQDTNDEDVARAKVCSTAVAIALRKEYMDPVPYLADDRVSPADLARSPLLQYLFTINGT
jgi:hypothetical protein